MRCVIPNSTKEPIVVILEFDEKEKKMSRTLDVICNKATEAISKAISGKCDFYAEFKGQIKPKKCC